jgi:hypothetical protein
MLAGGGIGERERIGGSGGKKGEEKERGWELP